MNSYSKWHCNMILMKRNEMDVEGVPVLSYDHNDYHTKYNTAIEKLMNFVGFKPDPLPCTGFMCLSKSR